MIVPGYEVTPHPDRSSYGVEWDIMVPGVTAPVTVAQDVFGEREERMQVFIYPASEEELELECAVSVRFNPDGSIAGVVVPDGIPVEGWCESTVSRWIQERDGF